MSDYIRDHDSLQQQQENEDVVIDTIVASMMRVNEKVFDKHRHAKRDAHAKSHGVLVGQVTVYDQLPPHLAQGVFARQNAPQQAYSHARRVFADDVLSFNPWHCIDEHRPPGSIMRARITAYEASSAFRHERNNRPRIKIDDIGQVPA